MFDNDTPKLFSGEDLPDTFCRSKKQKIKQEIKIEAKTGHKDRE